VAIGAAKNNPNYPTLTEDYIVECRNISKSVKNNDSFKRIINPTEEMELNYSVLINRTSISDWTHIVSSDFRSMFYHLGYGMGFTDISDEGGTAFSNALLNVVDAISKNELNEDLYIKKSDIESGYNYYKCSFTLPFGLMLSVDSQEIPFNNNFFDYQNSIYKLLKKNGRDLFVREVPDNSSVEKFVGKKTSLYDKNFEFDKEMYRGIFNYKVEEKSVLYFYLDDGSDISQSKMVVDDCELRIIKNGEEDLSEPIKYRLSYNNNIIELGTFENEDVTIELNSTHPEIDKPVVYAMSLEKLDNLCKNYKSCVTEYSTGKKSMSIKATGEEGRYLFVPVYNNGSWVCTVNGEKTDVKSVLGSFMAIPLKDGENNIYINYVPKTFYITLAFSALSLAAFIVIMILIKKKQFKAPEKLKGLFLWALTGLFAAFVTIAYIIPLIAQVYYAIVGRG